MGNLLKKLPSGATLEVTMASFEECDNLLTAVLHEAAAINLDLGKDFEGLKSLGELTASSQVINTVKNAFCQILKSRAVKDCVFVCATRGIYTPDGQTAGAKITRNTFEPEKARQDYIDFLREVAWFNLSPFFAGISSKFAGILGTIANTQQSKSEPQGPS